jgi:phosphomannomutase
MTINPNIFKAYDIRGVYPDEINEEVAYRVGRAIVVFTGAKTVVVGRDCRKSSEIFFKALERGITNEGADVIDIGLVSSPLFYFSVGDYDLHDAGIMITASHNPKQYNGLKLVRGNALPIGGVSGMDEIKRLVLENKWENKPVGNTVKTEVLDDYIQKVLGLVGVSKIKKLKVTVDAGNGMGGISLKKLAKYLPVKIISLYFEPDGNFPNHEANPTKPENLRDLQKAVLKEKANFGAALDGDGDRIAVIDENSEVVRGDFLVAILAQIMLKKYPGAKILYDVRCSNVVPETIRKFGGVPEMTPVGHAPIKNIMAKGDAVFGGELSNHFYFRDFYFAESPDLCLLLLLKYLADENKKMSEAIRDLKKYFHSGEINFEVKNKEGIIKKIKEKYFKNAKKITEIDGLRLDFDDWWFNVRPSNTEPLLRLNLEAKTEESMLEKKEELERLIKEF